MSRIALAALVLVTFGLGAGCASGEIVNMRGMDGSRPDAARGDAAREDAAVTCDPACADGETCVDGFCQAGVDLDGDGVLADVDCDDLDLAIGRTAERSCTSDCGTGVTRCTDGVWGDCTAPTTCDCDPGSPPRMIPCMHCGLQRQVCDGGLWRDDGECSGGGTCSFGERDVGGVCGTHCGSNVRTCMDDCTWGPWGCEEGTGCEAGTTEMDMQACGTCGTGTQTRTRTCSDSCSWGAWGSWSACSGGEMGVCSPGQTDMASESCPGGCATHTRSRTCDVAGGCVWGSWSAWSSCPTCGPVCGDGTCSGGETCSSCSDCHYGHGGSGSGGASCSGVPAETWRCVTTPMCGGPTSQVCRGGVWVNFNCAPRGCSSCVCSFSTACCQAGSPSGGC